MIFVLTDLQDSCPYKKKGVKDMEIDSKGEQHLYDA